MSNWGPIVYYFTWYSRQEHLEEIYADIGGTSHRKALLQTQDHNVVSRSPNMPHFMLHMKMQLFLKK